MASSPTLEGPALLQHLKSNTTSDIQSVFTRFSELYEKRLWHPLTLELLQFYESPSSLSYRLPLLKHFVLEWSKKMNPLFLVILACSASKTLPNNQDRITLFVDMQERVRADVGAYSLVMTECAQCLLTEGKGEECKQGLEKSKALLDGVVGLDYRVYASHFKTASEYDKVISDYSSFYKNALQYLGVVPERCLAEEEKVSWVRDLCVAALLGETVYNFGELSMHPLLNCLVGTPFAWLRDTILAFEEGRGDTFDAITKQYGQDPILKANESFLKQKLCLMSLVEFVFRKPAGERQLPFEEVAGAIRLPLEEVEFLVMKAMSLDLLRGKIDQVDRIVHVEWIQFRVLTRAQVASLARGIGQWQERAVQTTRLVQNETADWIVSNPS